MAYRVLIANVPVMVGAGEIIPIGEQIPQKLLTDAEIKDLVEPQYEGDRCRAHWETRGKGELEEKPKAPPKEDEKPAAPAKTAKPKGGKGK